VTKITRKRAEARQLRALEMAAVRDNLRDY
jgi:hypothetical protein